MCGFPLASRSILLKRRLAGSCWPPIVKCFMQIEKWASFLVALAAVAGAAGVTEAAYAAHGSADPLLQTSSHFLLLHAAAVIAVTGFAQSFQPASRFLLLTGSLLLLGTLLFCGDLSVRAFTSTRLFPMAAPLGGTTMIAGWLGTAIAALFQLRKSRTSQV